MLTAGFIVLLLLSVANLIRPACIVKLTTRRGGEFSPSVWWLYCPMWLWWGSRMSEVLGWMP